MTRFIFSAAFFFFIAAFLAPDYSDAMKPRNFEVWEKNFNTDKALKYIGEVTLGPGEEKSFTTYSYKPLTIDFKTLVTREEIKKIRNDGIGIKKLSNLKYYLKDPLSASMDVLPEDGEVNITVKNFEKFPITVKLYKKAFSSNT